MESENSKYDSRDNCNAIIETETNTLIAGCPKTIIPNSVTTIGAYAFNGCSGLTSITIPNGVTAIGENAFKDCSGLRMVISEISTPFDVNAFNWFDATLIVPKGSRTDYKSKSGWEFTFTFEEGETVYEREQTDEQGIHYTLRKADDDSYYYSVTGHSDELNTEIIIPADLDGCPVRAIDEYVFRECTSLLSITIPNSVTTIGARSFNKCSNLATVKMGKNVSSIGEHAFEYCTGLYSVTLPNKLESLGNGAFAWCPITSISIPRSVKTIGDEAFICCGELVSVSMEEGLTSIGVNAFRHCPITSITIPNSVTTIGSGAFSGIGTLTTAILGDGITEIKSALFEGSSALTSVTIPDGVTSIGEKAFNGCRLASVKIPESLTSMGENAFAGCPLKSIELPNSFTVIPANLFKNNDLEYIKLGDNVKSIGKNAFGSSLGKDETMIVMEIGTSTPPTIANDAFPNINLSELNVIVPDAAAETDYRKAAVWKEMTFANQDNITEVTVETPGDLSFELIMECNMMPAKVVGLKVNGTINADDFMQMRSNMKSLLRLDLSDCDITEIPDGAMKGKIQLQELTLPARLKTIGNNAFQNCPYLTGKLDLPSTITSIGDYAFEGTNYTSVSRLPNSLKTIGAYAFYNLPIEQSLTIPDGVTSIGDYAFANTFIQGHVTIPDGIKTLGMGVFRNTQISTMFLPNSITSVSRELFQGCPNLDIVYIPDNYTEVSDYAFDGCDALTTLRLSANLATMGGYAFQSTPLEYIKIPSQVEVLPQGVLKNCKSLVSLTLQGNLKTVEAEALNGCTALRNISVEAIDPPAIKDRSAIRGINTDLCLISIPTDSYKKYVLAEYWGQFVQMRNDIAVETEGNGEIAFESVEEPEEEDEEVSESRRRGARSVKRAPAADEESLTFANNGSSVYVPKEGKVRFYILPGEGEELLSATLDGEDIMPFIEDGIYTATADKKNAKLVVKFSGTVMKPGDANGDGEFDLVDVVAMINRVLGRPSDKFVAEAADLNGDEEVDVFDVMAAIHEVLNSTPTARSKARAASDTEEMASVTPTADGILLSIDDPARFTAFQFDVEVADGMELTGVRLTAETGHSLQFVKNGENTYRVIGVSMKNNTLADNGNGLVALSFSKDGHVQISNIFFVTPQETKVHFAVEDGMATGIAGMKLRRSEDIFDLSGRKVDSDRSRLPKGVYLINNKKVVIK